MNVVTAHHQNKEETRYSAGCLLYNALAAELRLKTTFIIHPYSNTAIINL